VKEGVLILFAETETAKHILSKKAYYLPEETEPDQMLRRVSSYVASAFKDEEPREYWDARFYNVMHSAKFVPNSPCLVNAGRESGGLFACFVLGMEDNLDSITAAKSDAMAITKAGGGWGIGLSSLRPYGSRVSGSTHGIAGGPVGFWETFSHDMRTMTQGGFRDAACMATMSTDHPDIYRFIRAKTPKNSIKRLLSLDLLVDNEEELDAIANGLLKDNVIASAAETYMSNFNISVLATDRFMKFALSDSDDLHIPTSFGGIEYESISPKGMLDEIAHGMWINGEPGLLFIDRIHERTRYNPEEITATNPCVVGSTRLHTSNGPINIYDLYLSGENISAVVDTRTLSGARGTCYRPTTPAFMTAAETDVFTVKTKQGYEITASKWHEFFTNRGKIKLSELKVGDKLKIQSDEGGFGSLGDEKLGELLGFFVGDGWISSGRAVLGFWGHKKSAMGEMLDTANKLIKGRSENNRAYDLSIQEITGREESLIQSSILANVLEQDYGVTAETKLSVPDVVWGGSRDCVRGFIRGLYFADGHIESRKNRDSSIVLSSAERSLLQQVQILLSNFGIFSAIYILKPAGTALLPNGKGGEKEYNTKESYRLVVGGESRDRFMEKIGLKSEEKAARYNEWTKSRRSKGQKQKFEATISEIVHAGREAVYDVTQPDHNSVVFNGIVTAQCGEQALPPNGSCCLGSINLAEHIVAGRLDEYSLKETVRVGVRFLNNMITLNRFPTDATRSWSLKHRSIGLGVMGFADALILMGIRYDSKEAVEFAKTVGSIMLEVATDESKNIYQEGYSRPVSETGEEIQGGWDDRNNHVLLSIAPTGTISLLAGCSSGIEPVFSEKILRVDSTGSHMVNHPLVNHESFVTLKDIGWDAVIDVVSAFSDYIDNSISYTVNLPNDATVEDVKHAVDYAWQMGCNGITIYRDGSRNRQVLNATGDTEKEDPLARPSVLDGKTFKYTGNIDGEKTNLYVTLNSKNGSPYEVFVHTPHIESMTELQLVTVVTRLSSLCMRYGIPTSEIVEQLRKAEGQSVTSVPAIITRAIAEYQGVSSGDCPECGSKMMYTGGCNVCPSCGHSSCG
jgi:ribonucleoside-diphosphate reductase alpha chain